MRKGIGFCGLCAQRQHRLTVTAVSGAQGRLGPEGVLTAKVLLRNHRLFVLLLLLFCFSFKNVKTKGNSFRNNIFKLLLQNSIYLQGDLKLEATAPRITVRPAGVRFEATS